MLSSSAVSAARDEAHNRLSQAMLEMISMKAKASVGLQAAMKVQEEQQQWTVASYATDPKMATALNCRR